MSHDDVVKIDSRIQLLEAEQGKSKHIEEERLILIKSTIANFDENFQKVIENEMNLKKKVNSIKNAIIDELVEMDINEFSLASSYINIIQRGIIEIENISNLLLEVRILGSSGYVRPELVNFKMLNQEIIEHTAELWSPLDLMSVLPPNVYLLVLIS